MDIYSLSENDRYKLLIQLALKLIRGKELTIDESEYIGRGLMAMTCGDNLNDAFRVKKAKSTDHSKHAIRYALVERKRAEGKTREAAIVEVAEQFNITPEAVDASHDKQSKIQKEFNKKVAALKLG